MSMLSSQADELRTLADKLRIVSFDERANYVENVDTLYRAMGAMREAADTITSLWNSLTVSEAALNKATVLNETRYQQLFGTPERAARTLAGIKCDRGFCDGCPLIEADCSLDSAVMLEWLRGDA